MNGREGQETRRALRGRVHAVELCNRETAAFTGVADVESFNEEEIVLLTDLGNNHRAGGEGLHIVKLNLDDGVLEAEGRILALEYADEPKMGKRDSFPACSAREKRCCLKRWDRRASFSG